MAPFTVIIVGGSISGLALANMLEKYDINFVVLEKHENISPPLGAGYSMLPYGLRILEQLGCYDVLEKLSTPVDSIAGYNENGKRSMHLPEIGKMVNDRFGYKIRFLERQQLVNTLYENICDKSKIHTSSGVVDVRLTATGVEVETDSEVFEGDIVVGADGVHSGVRHAMEELALANGDGELFQEKDRFQCGYRAIFGTSPIPKDMVNREVFKGYRTGRSHLCIPAKGGLIYWSAMFKNDAETPGTAMPRYTTEDRDQLAKRYENDIIKPGVRFGDLYQTAMATALVPIEEGVLSTCFYKRIVLVGDSWHKFNPLPGFGGNAAIASAAYLTDGLKDLLDWENPPTQTSIEGVFNDYQQAREGISRKLLQRANVMQRLEALDTPFLKFIQLKVMGCLPRKMVETELEEILKSASVLKRLSFPSRNGIVRIPYGDSPRLPAQSKSVSKFWVVSLVAATLLYYCLV